MRNRIEPILLQAVNTYSYRKIVVVIPLFPSKNKMFLWGVTASLYFYNVVNGVVIDYDWENSTMRTYSYQFYPNFAVRNLTNAKSIQLNEIGNDLKGHKIKFIHFDDYPQSFFVDDKFCGIDSWYLKTITEYFNVSTVIDRIDTQKTDDYFEIVINQMLKMNMGEFNINYIMYQPSNLVTGVYPSYIEKMCIILPFESSNGIVFKFGLLYQGANGRLFTITVFTSFVWFVLTKFNRYSQSKTLIDIFDYTLRGCLGSSMPIKRTTTLDKLVIASVFFYSFVILNIFTSTLVSELTHPFKPDQRLTTLAALNESNFVIHASHLTTKFKILLQSKLKLKFVRSFNYAWDIDYFDPNVGYIMQKRTADLFINSHLNRRQNGDDIYYIVNEFVHILPASYKIQKSLPYRAQLDLLTMRIQEANLMQYWKIKFKDDLRAIDFQDIGDDFSQMSENMVTLEHLAMVFLLIPVSGMMSFLLLIVEIIHARITKKGKKYRTSKASFVSN